MITDDPTTPGLKRSHDETPVPQADVYLVLSEEERARGFLQPVRTSYVHLKCGGVTIMGRALAETYARDPWFYSGTYCATCAMHRALSEFVWSGGTESLAPHKWTEEKLAEVMARMQATSAGRPQEQP